MKALFARFWIADLDASTHAFVMADTLFAISEFPEWAITEVCRDWITAKTTRPHAAELVGRCRQLVGADAVTLHNLRRFVDPDEQHQAPQREAERRQRQAEQQAAYTANRNEKIAAIEDAKKREAEAFAWRAENPDFSAGDPKPVVRPREREPASAEKRRQVADELATVRARMAGVLSPAQSVAGEVPAPISGSEAPMQSQSFTGIAAGVIADMAKKLRSR